MVVLLFLALFNEGQLDTRAGSTLESISSSLFACSLFRNGKRSAFWCIWAAGSGWRDERRWDEFGLRVAHSYITSTRDGLNLCSVCWIILSGPFCQSLRLMTALLRHPSVRLCPTLWPPCPCLKDMKWLWAVRPDEVCPAATLHRHHFSSPPKNRVKLHLLRSLDSVLWLKLASCCLWLCLALMWAVSFY